MNFTEFVNLLSSKPSEGRIFNPYGGEDLQSLLNN